MANKTIDIEEIETNTIFVNSKLLVTIKYSFAFVLIGGMLVFTIALIIFLKRHQYISFTVIFISLLITSYNYYNLFFPIKVPYLLIDSVGMGYKKNFPWHEIETIQYNIVNPNNRLPQRYIEIGLKNMKKISIDVNRYAIDPSIEVIAAYIKKYRSKH